MLKLYKDHYTYGSLAAKIKRGFMVVGGVSFYVLV